MHAEDATVENPKLNLPPDLMMALGRQRTPKSDFRVEGWNPSLFGRLLEKLFGRRS